MDQGRTTEINVIATVPMLDVLLLVLLMTFHRHTDRLQLFKQGDRCVTPMADRHQLAAYARR